VESEIGEAFGRLTAFLVEWRCHEATVVIMNTEMKDDFALA
jgi:hypothetical protein